MFTASLSSSAWLLRLPITIVEWPIWLGEESEQMPTTVAPCVVVLRPVKVFDAEHPFELTVTVDPWALTKPAAVQETGFIPTTGKHCDTQLNSR